MSYQFDKVPDRRDTASLKWQKYAGKEILPLWVADMDFASPPEVIEALQRRLDHGVFGYTVHPHGAVEAVQAYLKNNHNWSVEESEILWLPGLVPALNLACRAFADEGDAVLSFTPVYPPFLSAPGHAGRDLVELPLSLVDDRWTIDFEDLETAITPRTRLLLLCNPHNPGGTVFTRAELIRLGEICEKHDLIICSDEIHCDLVLESDQPHIPIATISPELAQRSLTLMAPSKTYNLPGLSCAFGIVQNPEIRRRFQQVARGIITEINLFGYAGCEAAFRHGEPWRKELIRYLRGNRDFVYQFLREHCPDIVLHPMAATYLAWLDVRKLNLTDPIAHFESHGVGLSEGKFFHGPGYVRLNFGCPRAPLEEGLERVRKAVDACAKPSLRQ